MHVWTEGFVLDQVSVAVHPNIPEPDVPVSFQHIFFKIFTQTNYQKDKPSCSPRCQNGGDCVSNDGTGQCRCQLGCKFYYYYYFFLIVTLFHFKWQGLEMDVVFVCFFSLITPSTFILLFFIQLFVIKLA